jgi:hypothetical protein
VDNADQRILYALREEIAQQQLGMNAAGLALGTGNAVLDSSRAQWQAEPDSIVTLTAVQVAAALAAAKYQALEHAYQVAQDVIAQSTPAAQAPPAAAAPPVAPSGQEPAAGGAHPA